LPVEVKEVQLSGEQDTIISVGVTTLVVWFTACSRLLAVVSSMNPTSGRLFLEDQCPGLHNASFPAGLAPGDLTGLFAPISPVWHPNHDFEFWVAAVAGVLLLVSYYCILKAYETANSTGRK
jgi:hypothetical protein